MPPRGVKKGTKRAREYEHIKAGAKQRGASTKRAEEIAARTVNKDRARAGESRTRSQASLPRQVAGGARRAATPARTGRRVAPASNSTKRPGAWACPGAPA